MENISGQVIKGYHLQEMIGEGGFGAVYRAYQPSVEREVAIKAILPTFANHPNFIRRFKVEAQLIARLEHPHIVPLYDYWREPSGAYLVMRWVRGGNLQESLKEGAWGVDAAARLLDQLAGALAVAHRNNVVHQDIKPANILLDEDANVYLSDFGIAKDLTGGVNLAVVEDNDEAIHGSPAYMSPEQITRQTITAQTDIYSLGLLLYETLTGKGPFEGASFMDLLKHQTSTPLPPLQTHRADLPDSLNLVIWRATSKDPDHRYPTTLSMAQDFQAAIARSAEGTQPSAVPVGKSPTRTPSAVSTSVVSLPEAPNNPYKGLRAFQEADAADFFGRDALVDTLIERLGSDEDSARFLAVVGPSGSGKSSAVKAGLIPALRAGKLPGWDEWYIQEMSPGAHPLAELEAAILRVAVRTDQALLSQLHDDPAGLVRVIAEALPDDENDFILVIDQFEEVFTLVEDEAQRSHFLALLHQAVTAPGSRLRVIVTLRADFYDRPLLYAGLGDLIRLRTEVVLPLSVEELQQTIVGPASRVGLILEPGLVDMIVDDVLKQPSSLPLLQYMLTELYERRSHLKLTLQAYRAIGGVSGALARRADEIFDSLTEQKQAVARQLFLRLVSLGEGTEDTRRRAEQSELQSIEGDRKAMQEVIEVFGKYRLLAFDHDPITRTPTVEVAHEALIRSWGRLQEWLNTNRDNLRAQRRLAVATAEWARGGRDQSYLASGARLAQFESLVTATIVALNAEGRDYVRASIALQQRAVNRLRLFIVTLALISILAFGFALIALDQRNEAEDARSVAVSERDRADVQAAISRSRELAASALINLEDGDLPLLLSLEALAVADTFEARNSLLSSLQVAPRLEAFLHGHEGAVRSLSYSADGRLLASGSRDNSIILWNMVEQRMARAPLSGHTGWVNGVVFSPDGTRLVSGGNDGMIILWDVNTGSSVIQPVAAHAGGVWSVAYSPDGTLIASGGADGVVRLWDAETLEPLGEPLEGHTDVIYEVAFAPDGETLASGSADGTARLWDLSTLQDGEITSRRLVGHTDWVFTLAFSPDGATLATGSQDTTIRLWEVESGAPIGVTLDFHDGMVRSLDFDSTGRLLASGGEDSRVLIWDLATGRLIDGFFNLRRQPVWGVAFSGDDRTLVTSGLDPSVLVWSLRSRLGIGSVLATGEEQVLDVAYNADGSLLAFAGGLDTAFGIQVWDTDTEARRLVFEGHTNTVMRLSFDPVQPRLASASLDRTVRIWDTQTGEQIGMIELGDSVFSVAFSPDGRLVAMGDNDGIVTLWDVSGDPADWEQFGETIAAHSDQVLDLAFSPDGRLLASGSRDARLMLWDVASQSADGEPMTAHTDGVVGVAFSPDGRLLASGSRDQTVILWDVETHAPIGEPLHGHTNWVMDVVFNDDGSILASASGDRTVILWDVALGRPIGQPMEGHSDWVNSVTFSPGGRELASAGRDTRVILWSTDLSTWRARACQVANRDFSLEELQLYFQGTSSEFTCEQSS